MPGNTGSVSILINNIDKTAPTGSASYSTTDPTNQDVTATITTSEAIETPAGWTKVSDTEYWKVYSGNTTETITITDAAGNTGSVNIAISNIDKTAPTGSVSYSTTDPTDEDVTVTLTTDKPIETPTGWTKVSDTEYWKVYSGNTTETVTITDTLGNTGSVSIVINNIETATLEPEEDTTGTVSQFSKAYGVIDIAWLDTDNNVISEPEAPVLCGMTPVKWEGAPGSYAETTTTDEDIDWYSYTAQTGDTTSGGTSKWANAVTANGNCYFVWIPRYAYKITYFNSQANANAYRANSSSTTGIIGYSNIYGMLDQASGKVVGGTAPTNTTGTVQTTGYTEYIPHPAFTFGSTEEKGIWMGKYQSTGTISSITIKPNYPAIASQTVSTMFSNSQNVSGANSISADSHMMRNTEWGAAAYLCESKYGRNGTGVRINNNSEFYTGWGANADGAGSVAYSATSTDNLYTGQYGVVASTTGNIYGVYDMSGGSSEYIAGYVNNGNAALTNYNLNLINAMAKYKDVYQIGPPDAQSNNYNANKGIKGDAVYETSTSYSGLTSWHGDDSAFVNGGNPVFARGR